MNAIIALCHFCDYHGPRILFCTQPIHQQQDASQETDGNVSDTTNVLRDRHFQSPTSIPKSGEPLTPMTPTSRNDMCEACRSVQSGFVSHDDDAQLSYVSHQHPHHPQVFSMVRQACVRSLSCEVCPGREGPIFFGDEHRGHVLSYTFYIQDSQARGLQRWYSILVIMMDKVYLLNSWPFLVPNLQVVIKRLQAKAQRVHDTEQAKCPQRQLRLSRMAVTPENFRHQRGVNRPTRSLTELTDDKNVFKLLHVSFAWILKACGSRITETLLEGPPTEDSIIDMEKQEETEEGFIKLFSKKVSMDDEENGEASKPPVELDGNQGQITGAEEFQENGIKTLRKLLDILGNYKFHVLAHQVIIGNQIIVQGGHKGVVKSILMCLKCLLPRGCSRVVPYSESYEESWRCNFLGLAPNVTVPSHVISNEMFLLVIVNPIDKCIEPETANLKEFEFDLQSSTTLPSKGPSVLNKMELALKNKDLNDDVVEQCLICMKEEWMNKVKVLFKFTKAGGSRSEEDRKKLLQVVGAQPEDTYLLKFWMTGLSVQYRTHILTASKSQTNSS